MTDPAPSFSLRGRRVWVAGHRGMAGSAIVRRLASEDCEILTAGRDQMDLRRQEDVEKWMSANRPEVVFLAAATVGGILANSTRPGEFIYDNLQVEANVIHTSYLTGVEKLLFLGSSCIYPKHAPQPMSEDLLLTGTLEPTNEWYAIAKIAGIKMCQAYRRQYGCNFITAMPTNLFGPGDRYDLAQGHVVAALMMKIHQAKVDRASNVELWGTGKPLREFLYVDDLADACVFLVKNYSGELHINIGSGIELTICQLAETVAAVVGWNGTFRYDSTKPDGTSRKVMDVSRLNAMGWRAGTSLECGLGEAYKWYLRQASGLE